MRVLDLFAGIGGFTIGLEKAGFETVAFCEIEPYAQKVLRKNWPGVKIYDDVRGITAERLAADGIGVDVITGGFPCQDISVAGKGAGIEGERSGLWSECARLIGELRPRYAIFENVTNLLNGERGDWFKRVLGDISALGYDAEWHCIPASAIGAHHHRDRVWIMAYPAGARGQAFSADRVGDDYRSRGDQRQFACAGQQEILLANTDCDDGRRRYCAESPQWESRVESWCSGKGQSFEPASEDVADTDSRLRDGEELSLRTGRYALNGGGEDLADTLCSRVTFGLSTPRHGEKRNAVITDHLGNRLRRREGADYWSVEPDVGRVVDGVPDRAHRLKCLGNAVVPQIPEIIGKAIMEAENDYNHI
jgi:DNA (cytosine-5)-methyltransferase 1